MVGHLKPLQNGKAQLPPWPEQTLGKLCLHFFWTKTEPFCRDLVGPFCRRQMALVQMNPSKNRQALQNGRNQPHFSDP